MEDKKPNNSPAFPSDFTICGDREMYQGMTLRDYFANSAMQANLYIPRTSILTESNIKSVAISSYAIADAMLKQREL